MSALHRILIAHSADWLGTARLPRLFARAGIATTALAVPGTLLWQSRFVDQRIAAPREIDAFVDMLRRTIEEQAPAFSFVILADDPIVEALATRAGEPWLDACFPVDHRAGDAALLTSKFAFIDGAKAAALPLPRSEVAASPHEACRIAADIGYPVMVKRQSGTGGAGVRRANDAVELVDAFNAFGDPALNIEEYIEGVMGASETLYDRGRLVAAVSFEKLRRYPAPYGPSAIRRTMQVPGLDAMLEGAGRMTGFHGFTAICWQYDPQRQRIALLEMNPRPGSGMHLYPEPALIFSQAFKAMLDGERVARPAPIAAGTTYRMFPQDVRRLIVQRDLVGALAWIPGLPSARDIPWDDRPLLRAHLRELVHDYLPWIPHALAAMRRRAVEGQ